MSPSDWTPKTLLEVVECKAAEHPTTVAFLEETSSGHRPVTHERFWEDIQSLARALRARGVRAFDRVGVRARPCYLWEVADKAIMLLQAVSVGVDPTTSPSTTKEILTDAGVTALVTDDVSGVRFALRDAGIRAEKVFLMSPSDELPGAASVTTQLEAHRMGHPIPERPRQDRVATLTYTSGTTGKPKGIPYTHAQLALGLQSMKELFADRLDEKHRTLAWLPLHNQTGRTLSAAAYYLDVEQCFVGDPKTLADAMRALSPTFMVVVPRVLEKVTEGIERTLEQRDLPSRIGLRLGRALMGRSSTPEVLRDWVDGYVARPIREAVFGRRLKFLICGSAPLEPRVQDFVASLGVELLIAYGLSECATLVSMHRAGRIRSGTVGEPTPGMRVRLSAGGEICVRHPSVHESYWGEEEPSNRDVDGYLRTGDLGEWKDGQIVVTGRCKELIKTSTGLRVSPQAVEQAYGPIPGVGSLMVVGDRQPFLTALVSLEPETLQRIAERGADPRRHVLSELQARAPKVARNLRIRDVALLPAPPTVERGELTSTLKLRRKVIAESHADLIDAMYAGRAKPVEREAQSASALARDGAAVSAGTAR